ncbi:MAG: hypothetical protein ACKPE6_13375, partial [Gammaproteobacteria bacterium]
MSDAPSSAAPLLGRRHVLGLALGAAAASAVLPAAAAPRSAASASTMPEVDALAEALIAERIVPGLSLAVMRGGSILHAR